MPTPYTKLSNFLKKSFTVIMKDHMPAPPIAGLVWDAAKHRWASGVGQRGQTSVGGRGKGVARKFTEGRRFRETNYPPFPAPKPKGGRQARAKRGKTQRRRYGG